jgi:Mn-dependent DtxR family transcriptional regulator
MLGRRKDVVYRTLATKKRAVALHKLSAELETPAPTVLKTVKELESDGLVEVFYGQGKASIMVRAKTLEDYI